jgi:hypothetical protein
VQVDLILSDSGKVDLKAVRALMADADGLKFDDVVKGRHFSLTVCEGKRFEEARWAETLSTLPSPVEPSPCWSFPLFKPFSSILKTFSTEASRP